MKRAGAALGWLVLTVTEPSAASPAQSLGFGARGTSMAGAVSADVHDASAVFYNPAGLALGKGAELSVGYGALGYDLELGRTRTTLEPIVALEAGVVARGAIAGVPFAAALALDLPNGKLSKLSSFREGEPRWALYESTPELVDLGAVVALRPFEFLAVGGGLGFLAATRGGFRVNGTALLPDGAGAEHDSELRHEVHAELVSVRYPIFGVTLTPSERLSFALTYRDRVTLEQRITGTLDGEVDATFARIPVRYHFETLATIGFLPRQFTLGTSVHVVPELAFNVDLVWQDWSEYPSPVGSSEVTLDARVPPGLDVDLPADSPRVTPAAPGFEDRIVPRIALESTLPLHSELSLSFRTGYAFEESPAARHQLSTALIDADRHLVSFGSGFVWKPRSPWLPSALRFDTHALFARLVARKMTVLADGVSRDLPASGTLWSVGATLGLGFE